MLRVLNLKDIKLCSINNKYISGRFVLTKEYRAFKNLICDNVECDVVFSKNISVRIKISTYKDIDSTIKCTFDALEDAGVIENDREIIKLWVYKNKIKRGQPESIEVLINGE